MGHIDGIEIKETPEERIDRIQLTFLTPLITSNDTSFTYTNVSHSTHHIKRIQSSVSLTHLHAYATCTNDRLRQTLHMHHTISPKKSLKNIKEIISVFLLICFSRFYVCTHARFWLNLELVMWRDNDVTKWHESRAGRAWCVGWWAQDMGQQGEVTSGLGGQML